MKSKFKSSSSNVGFITTIVIILILFSISIYLNLHTKQVQKIKKNVVVSVSNSKAKMIHNFESWIGSQRIWKDGKMIVFSPEYSHRLAEAIVKYSDYPIIMLSICYNESKFNQTAKSSTNAIGVGQVSLVGVPELIKAGILTNPNGKELYDLAVNIKSANFIFNQKLNKTKGDVDAAFDLYSGGAKKYSAKIKKTVFDIVFFIESTNKK